jgi:hypothetical protein
METQLINEVIAWVGLTSAIKIPTTLMSVSDLILTLYVISYFNIKKGSLIVAFLVCELWGYGVFSDWVTNQGFYAGYAAIYCLLYFHVKNNTKSNIAELSSIVLMILLVIGMIVDAEFYPETETSFWQSYEINVLLLHAFIIISFINWRLLRTYMGESVNGICRFFGVSDAFRFCWYNVTNKS